MSEAATAKKEVATNVGTDADNKLSKQLASRGVSNAAWHTLSKSLYPGALPESILLVIDYCKARGRDPLKKPCHIVPMEVRDAKTGEYVWRDVILPGIYELRATAHDTKEYLGHAKPVYGPEIDYRGVKAPEFCDFTVYRWHPASNQRAEYPVRVYFAETVGVKKGGEVNARWKKAPRQMLTKCAEAAALREAFPDQFGGGDMIAEEIEGPDGNDHRIAPAGDGDDAARSLNRELEITAPPEQQQEQKEEKPQQDANEDGELFPADKE